MTLQRQNATIYIAFFFLTIGFSYPAIVQLSTHAIGYQGDIWQYPLNLFFFRERILEGRDPYYTDFIFHPAGTSLLLHNYTELHDAVALLLHPILNDLAASNFLILASTFLTAIGTYKLALELYPNRLGAAFAAIAFAFCPNRMFRTFSQVHMALTQWFPFAFYSLLKLARASGAKLPATRYVWLIAIFSVLTCYTNYYFAVYLAIAIALILLSGMALVHEWRTWLLWKRLLLTAAIAVVLLAPIARRFWIDQHENAVYEFEDVGFAAQKSADLSDYVKVGTMNPLIKKTLAGTFLQARSINTTGWVVLAFAFCGIYFAWKNRQNDLKIFFFLGIVFCVLSLGPYLQVGKQWTLLLPDYFLMKLPVISHVRFPARFSVLVALPLALLAGYAVSVFFSRLEKGKQKAFAGVSCGLLLLELCPAPIPMKAFDPPAIFGQIAREPYECMLTIPYFPGVGKYTDNMRYILAHHKKIMEGKIARTPKAQADYLVRIPIGRSLYFMTTDQGISGEAVNTDAAISPFFLSFYDIHYLTIFPPFSSRPDVQAYVHAVFPQATQASSEKDILVYRMEPARPEFSISANDPRMQLLLYENGVQTESGEVQSKGSLKLMLPATRNSETLHLQLTLSSVRTQDVSFVLNRRTRKAVSCGAQTIVAMDIPGSELESSGRILTLPHSGSDLKLLSIQYSFRKDGPRRPAAE